MGGEAIALARLAGGGAPVCDAGGWPGHSGTARLRLTAWRAGRGVQRRGAEGVRSEGADHSAPSEVWQGVPGGRW